MAGRATDARADKGLLGCLTLLSDFVASLDELKMMYCMRYDRRQHNSDSSIRERAVIMASSRRNGEEVMFNSVHS